MSGRGKGGMGLGKFVRRFDAKETIPLFLRVLPKKYHEQFQATDISEETLHTMINDLFEGFDIREELSNYLDMPPRYRMVQIKETRPLYEKLCMDYQKKKKQTSKEKMVVAVKQQKVSVPKQEKMVVAVKQQKVSVPKQEKMDLYCKCRKTN